MIIRSILMLGLAAWFMVAAAESYARKPVFPSMAQASENITVRQITPIAFGTFASSGNGGSITIDAGSGARILSGSVSTLSSGDYGQAEFIISGPPGARIIASPPASTILSNAGGGSVTLTDFKVSPSEIITLDREGIAKIKIGASLKVPGKLVQGSYSGFFDVTARYAR